MNLKENLKLEKSGNEPSQKKEEEGGERRRRRRGITNSKRPVTKERCSSSEIARLNWRTDGPTKKNSSPKTRSLIVSFGQP